VPPRKDLLMDWKNALKAVSAIVVFVGAWYGLNAHVLNLIENKINDPSFIQKVSREVRPSSIFDHNASVLADSGGMRYINEITVALDDKTKEPNRITLSPNRFLGTAPIVECLNSSFDMKATRGKKYDWTYELSSPPYAVFGKSKYGASWVFRFEIVK
jgi:hypothetical protein